MTEVNKNLQVLALVITFLLAFIPAVYAYGSLNQKVENHILYDDDKTERIISLEDRILVLEKIAAGTEVQLSVIHDDVQEIKTDIRAIAIIIREQA